MGLPILPITQEIDDLIREIQRLKEQIDKLKGISETDRDILRNAEARLREKTNLLKTKLGRRRLTRLNLGLRTAGYGALIYLLVAALYDRSVDLTPFPEAGSGACDLTAPVKIIEISESAPGPKTSLNEALAAVTDSCKNSKLICNDPECPSCGADVVINQVEVKTRIFWYTTEIKATCRCWCK